MKENCRMQLSEHARRVLQTRYLRRDAHGEVSETPNQLFARVARAIAYAELLLGDWEQPAFWEERFYRLLTSLDFLPNSPTLRRRHLCTEDKPVAQLTKEQSEQ
jgi:ribonucleoside-diphosphate reductase alpha chain